MLFVSLEVEHFTLLYLFPDGRSVKRPCWAIGKVFDDAASPSVDSLVVDVLQNWESHLGFLDHSLQVRGFAVPIPHCNAVAEDALIAHLEDFCW